jgi:hypothetical protein
VPRAGSPTSSPRSAAGATGRRARLDFDLHHEVVAEGRFPLLGSIEGIFHERAVEERARLPALAEGLLRALHDVGYRRADRWELDPGGWIPLPEEAHRGSVEPIAHLLRALASESWGSIAEARGLTVLVSSADGRSATAVLRRFHRERDHTLSIEVEGSSRRECGRLVEAVRDRLPVLRARVSGVGSAG